MSYFVNAADKLPSNVYLQNISGSGFWNGDCLEDGQQLFVSFPVNHVEVNVQ